MSGRATSPVSLPRAASPFAEESEGRAADDGKRAENGENEESGVGSSEKGVLVRRSVARTPEREVRVRGSSVGSGKSVGTPLGAVREVFREVEEFYGRLDELQLKVEEDALTTARAKELLQAQARGAASVASRLRDTGEEFAQVLRDVAEEMDRYAEDSKDRAMELDDDVEDLGGEEAQGGEGLSAKEKLARTQRARRLFSEPTFRTRPSLLTSMLHRDPSFASIYNLASASLIWLFLNVVTTSYFSTGKLVDLSLLVWGFSRMDLVVPAWCLLFCLSFVVVPLVQAVKLWKLSIRVWAPLYAAIQVAIYSVPTYIVLTVTPTLPPPAAMIVMCEAARFSMKSHAYFREKLLHGLGPKHLRSFIPRWAQRAGVHEALLHTPHITVSDFQTEVGRYMYFSFCPVLIYRDSYPRTGPRIRWIAALSNLFNFLMVILFTYALWVTFCEPQFIRTAVEPGDARSLLLSVFRSMLPGTMTLVLMHFGILHCWLNFWAELLRFGDRGCAYQDWWSADGFATFYRKWNNVVGGFLRNYVYLDTIRFSHGAIGRTTAQSFVFFISALIHEHIVACAGGFFYPILLLLFGGPGIIFMSISKRFGTNIFLWAMLIIGTGVLLVAYAREWYARYGQVAILNATVEQEFGPLLAPIVPRSWLAFLWAHQDPAQHIVIKT